MACTVCRLGLRIADVAATFLAGQPTLRRRRFVSGGGIRQSSFIWFGTP